MDDPTRPEPDVDPSALLEDWLASAAVPPLGPPPAPGPPDEGVEALPWAPGLRDEGAPATLLDALAADTAGAADIAGAEAETAGLPHEQADDRPRTRLVLFAVAGSMYGVSQSLVTEVARVPAITPVPHVPAWVRGVVNLRGDVFSVVDLRVFIGLDATSPHTGRLIVVRLADEDFSTGLLVDAVDQIASVPCDEVRPPTGPLEGALAPFLTGVTGTGDRLVAVLDLDRLLRSADIRQFEDRREEASCEARI
ncbi:MAG TPA: chemotaxis protein CheW [Vicinamibacterales bacterium]|nr:chemotaxis protein CheW [Vicinamibacterales bacterium]